MNIVQKAQLFFSDSLPCPKCDGEMYLRRVRLVKDYDKELRQFREFFCCECCEPFVFKNEFF